MSLSSAWQDPSIPAQQLAVVEKELETFRVGGKVPPFDTLANILGFVPGGGLSLLEIGASSAFNSEVLKIAGLDFDYHACDYSQEFKELAAVRYPGIPFTVADACDLPYPDASFDVVVSGGCLMHIADYVAAIREAVRVSKKYVLFHRTPIVCDRGTFTFTKEAYGVKMTETHFNHREFQIMMQMAGLKPVAELDVFWDVFKGEGQMDYLMRKAVVE